MSTSEWQGELNRERIHDCSRTAIQKGEWTHFSIFEVWDNITQDEVAELEGLFRHIYRKDTKANALNEQRGFKKLKTVGKKSSKTGKTGGLSHKADRALT